MLCASLAFAFSTQAAGTPLPGQEQQQPQPTPTPYVRQRTVTPKELPEQKTTQTPATETTPPQTARPEPAPTQAARPDSTDSKQTAGAPSQAAEEVDEDEVVHVESNLVIIPASVVDGRGRAITDLKVEDFELKIDGEVKPIGDLSRSETPVHVALLFDNSYSLSAAREFEKQAAVRFFRSVVRPIDRAAVYSISNTPILSQGLTNDVPSLVRTIERFGAPEGATALFEAVAQAADYMRPLAGRKVLVIVSDGADTVSEVSFDDAINRALRAECQVYVVQTRQVEDPNLHDPVSEQRMYRITEQTGGAVYIPQSVDELDGVFTQISLDLSQQYLLSYYPQDERKDKYFRFISLRVKSRPTLRVRARKGFYPDAAQAQTRPTADRTQFAGSHTNNSTPGFVAAAPAPRANDAAASYRRTAGESVTSASARTVTTSARNRPGPDGPDTDDADARSKPASNDPVPTFTVTTSAPAAAAKSPAAPERASVNNPSESGTGLFGALATPAPTRPKIETAAATRSPATNGVEERNAKPNSEPPTDATDARANEKTKTAEKSETAETTKPADAEKPKTTLSGGVLNGKALSLPVPAYPPAARNSGAHGKVVVEVMIDERGRVIEAHAISGHSFLQQAAVQAARQARFTPALLSGEPVKVRGTINYVFTLP